MNCCKLKVKVVEGRHFTSEDPLGKSDLFVKVFLSKSNQVKTTQTIQDNHNPVWNAQFLFNVQLEDDTMYFDVFDEDVTSNDLIGHGNMKLAKVLADGKLNDWVKIFISGGSTVAGEIHVTVNVEVSPFLQRI